MQDNVLADTIHIFGDYRIVDELRLFVDLGRQHSTLAHFRLGSFRSNDPARPDALINVPLPDHRRVFAGRKWLLV